LNCSKPVAKGKKSKVAKTKAEPKIVWPTELLEQTQAVRGVVKVLQDAGTAVTSDAVAERFIRAPRARVEEMLRVLAALGFVGALK
jgi:hypothetical protein